jgi:putative ABC transport system permease protein
VNIQRLIKRSLFCYKSFYRLIAIAVIIAVAVIVGSLVVGDSVRSTLVKRVDERLGKTETIIFSQYSYLDVAIIDSLNVGARFTRPGGQSAIKGGQTPPLHRGILLMNGFVSVFGTLTPAMAWGAADLPTKNGQATINRALCNEISVGANNHLPLQQNVTAFYPIADWFAKYKKKRQMSFFFGTVP